jgi:hypothetical protein
MQIAFNVIIIDIEKALGSGQLKRFSTRKLDKGIITMPLLFFTKAAAARLLPFATKIEAVRVFKGSIQVTYLTKNGRCSTFLSKTAFFNDFVSFRYAGAQTVVVKRWPAGSYQNHYECLSGKGENIRTVKLVADTANCSCPDWERQREELVHFQ